MIHIHKDLDHKKWVIRPNKSQLILYRGNFISALSKALSISMPGDKICIHNKKGQIVKII